MEKWIETRKSGNFTEIGKRHGIDPVIARIMRNRDISTDDQIEEYLHGGIEHLNDPHHILQKSVPRNPDIDLLLLFFNSDLLDRADCGLFESPVSTKGREIMGSGQITCCLFHLRNV